MRCALDGLVRDEEKNKDVWSAESASSGRGGMRQCLCRLPSGRYLLPLILGLSAVNGDYLPPR